uniref:Ovule protein n=1 Tax=Anisakis simplex TaxID=6269 RepID=A0A0M3IZF3_ANISI
LALTDHRIMKVPSLQLIVMNLQIGLIRSQCSFKNAILYTICSPLMRDIYVSITPEMGSIADALIEVC